MAVENAEVIPLEELDLNQGVFGCAVLIEDKDLYLKAIEEGYKDEICGKCRQYFAAYKHFVRCEQKDCPMKDGKPSLLNRLLD